MLTTLSALDDLASHKVAQWVGGVCQLESAANGLKGLAHCFDVLGLEHSTFEYLIDVRRSPSRNATVSQPLGRFHRRAAPRRVQRPLFELLDAALQIGTSRGASTTRWPSGNST
jgi:hypothetical protein